jgi:peptidoglycan-associated lipoprotein
MFKKSLIAVLAIVLLTGLAGCKSTSNDRNGGRASGDFENVNPGTQGDLEVNVGDRVFFAFDRSDIDAEGQNTLARQAEWLKEYPDLKISIEGHADDRGTREYNLALGERRANAAKMFLVSAGIDSSRISVMSYGKERPAVMGSGEEVWSQNRRAVTVSVN